MFFVLRLLVLISIIAFPLIQGGLDHHIYWGIAAVGAVVETLLNDFSGYAKRHIFYETRVSTDVAKDFVDKSSRGLFKNLGRAPIVLLVIAGLWYLASKYEFIETYVFPPLTCLFWLGALGGWISEIRLMTVIKRAK